MHDLNCDIIGTINQEEKILTSIYKRLRCIDVAKYVILAIS